MADLCSGNLANGSGDEMFDVIVGTIAIDSWVVHFMAIYDVELIVFKDRFTTA